MNKSFNKFLYLGFLLLGSYQALVTKDYMQAAASFGIGLAFDPFNIHQQWADRPQWQKAVLISNLALVGLLFGIALLYKA